MDTTETDVLIVGGGIAGLRCAYDLQRAGRPFVLLTDQIGGRIRASSDGRVNYGAYVVGPDTTFSDPFLRRTRRLRPQDVIVHGERDSHSTSLLRSPRNGLTLLWLLHRYRRAYRHFHASALRIGQRRALEHTSLLQQLTTESAADMLTRYRLQQYCAPYITPIVRMCTFAPLRELSAFTYLHVAMHLTLPVHEFAFDADRIRQQMGNHVHTGTVTSVVRETDGYTVHTREQRRYIARHLILATPLEVTQSLVDFPVDRRPTGATMLHLRGKLRAPYARGTLHVFPDPHELYFFSLQHDGSTLLYATSAHPNLRHVFTDVEVIATREWRPAFPILGSGFRDATVDDRLTVIGDYNIVGIEDAALTGAYAVHHLLTTPTPR